MPHRVSWPDSVALLVPVYDGGAAFRAFLPEVLREVPAERVLVVDDGSRDGSGEWARAQGVATIGWPENRGKGHGLRAGLEWWAAQAGQAIQVGKGQATDPSEADTVQCVVTLDADGQHRVQSALALARVAESGEVGLVLGCRDLRSRAMPWPRRLSNRITSWMLGRLAGHPISDSQSGFRCYGLGLVRAGVLPDGSRFDWESEVLVRLLRAGYRIAEHPIPTVYLSAGPSHIRHGADTARFLKLCWRLWREA